MPVAETLALRTYAIRTGIFTIALDLQIMLVPDVQATLVLNEANGSASSHQLFPRKEPMCVANAQAWGHSAAITIKRTLVCTMM